MTHKLTGAYLLEISRGNVDGMSFVNKYGMSDHIDTDAWYAIWDGNTEGGDYPDIDYTFPSDAGSTMYISSSDNGDIQNYEIEGLDENFDEQTVIQAVAGHSVTEIGSGILWTRVHRIKNVGSIDNAGIIFVNEENNHTNGIPNSSPKIAAMISIGKNQTMMAIYTVPRGKTAYLIQAAYGCGKADDFRVKLCIKPFGGVFQIKDQQTIYQENVTDRYIPYPAYPEKSDIKVMAMSLTSDNKPFNARFDLILIDDGV